MAGKKKLILTDQRVIHLLRHFSEIDISYRLNLHALGMDDAAIKETCQLTGSKFDASQVLNPEEILQLLDKGKQVLEVKQPNGNTARSVEFDKPIGTEGIVSLDELSKDEKKHIKEALRNGLHLKAVRLSELKKTNRLTYVVNSQNEIVTAFPGRYAPPLPFPEMPFDEKKNATEFWLNHVFVELT
jgi:hypothetical protein